MHGCVLNYLLCEGFNVVDKAACLVRLAEQPKSDLLQIVSKISNESGRQCRAEGKFVVDPCRQGNVTIAGSQYLASHDDKANHIMQACPGRWHD
jgi:hypothetical protein